MSWVSGRPLADDLKAGSEWLTRELGGVCLMVASTIYRPSIVASLAASADNQSG